MRIGEKHLDILRDGKLRVFGKLHSLIPGQRRNRGVHRLFEPTNHPYHHLIDTGGSMVSAESAEEHKPAAALHQRR